jgi:DNA-binding transcriptional ArsR family regulator
MPIREYDVYMARAPATADVFNAIAEPRRREILIALVSDERDVTALVEALGWPQPQISKHLGVLRQVGLVSVERKGRHRVYSVNGQELRAVYDWVKTFEKLWEHQLDRIKQRAEQMQRKAKDKK